MNAPAQDAPRHASGDLYAEVLQFHSYQLQLLDEGLYDDSALRQWADTFTEDGEYWVNSKPSPTRGREKIYVAARTNNISQEIIDASRIRRHLITNLVVELGDDDTIHSTYYVALVDTALGGPAIVGPATVANEVLVRKNGRLQTLRRKVDRDDLRVSFTPSQAS